MKWIAYVIMCKGYAIVNEATSTKYVCVLINIRGSATHLGMGCRLTGPLVLSKKG